MHDLEKEMVERLAKEKCFENLEDALAYAILLQRTSNESVSVFRNPNNTYTIVHLVNYEIATQLGYAIVYGDYEIYYAAQSDKKPVEAIGDFRALIAKNKS